VRQQCREVNTEKTAMNVAEGPKDGRYFQRKNSVPGTGFSSGIVIALEVIRC
jgi:hypothetical protein